MRLSWDWVGSEHGDVERGGCATGVGVAGGHLDTLPVSAAACDGAEGVAETVTAGRRASPRESVLRRI
ncbi:hypothetical protein EES42_31780 [Streptomyces sp. ADI95-17]|nr:hypothetical protein EES42_31780 [Streptomyces sp. ADI95-17]